MARPCSAPAFDSAMCNGTWSSGPQDATFFLSEGPLVHGRYMLHAQFPALRHCLLHREGGDYYVTPAGLRFWPDRPLSTTKESFCRPVDRLPIKDGLSVYLADSLAKSTRYAFCGDQPSPS